MPVKDLTAYAKVAANRLGKLLGVQVVRVETLDRLKAQAGGAGIRNPLAAAPPATHDLAGEVAGPSDENLSAKHFHELGTAARAKGDDARALQMFARAISLIPRYGPSCEELRMISREYLAKLRRGMPANERLMLLARALEFDPVNSKIRRDLEQTQMDRQGVADLTKTCFIFHDAGRARQIHEEAYRRALEFVTLGGVAGDVLEFGVLGGWSARIFSEIMRDILNLNNLHLFDLFEGLPEYVSAVDRDSYEIGGRDIWHNKMKFPDEFLTQFGQPHYWHIRDRLSEVIRPERIIVHKGFYSETLKHRLDTKAAVIHFDCDLYQSAREVLWGLHGMDALQDGTVMLFDDWNCNRGNPNYGERRALREYLAEQTRFTATPWFTYGYNGSVFILHDSKV